MYSKYIKRIFDLIMSALLLIILSPFIFLMTIIGLIAMRGCPFFTQLRPGLIDAETGKERIFRLVKFRTMSNAKDTNGDLLPDALRLNSYGKFLRSTSLDELPELINIFIGDMSFVGPRPQLVRDMVFMTDSQRIRHSVRPGLTGLAQVNGRNNITWEQKFEYDLLYINNGISFTNDFKIIFNTVAKVVKREDTNREGTASDMDFGDWLVLNGNINQLTYDSKQAEARELLET